jgi:hypothetical protein
MMNGGANAFANIELPQSGKLATEGMGCTAGCREIREGIECYWPKNRKSGMFLMIFDGCWWIDDLCDIPFCQVIAEIWLDDGLH